MSLNLNLIVYSDPKIDKIQKSCSVNIKFKHIKIVAFLIQTTSRKYINYVECVQVQNKTKLKNNIKMFVFKQV